MHAFGRAPISRSDGPSREGRDPLLDRRGCELMGYGSESQPTGVGETLPGGERAEVVQAVARRVLRLLEGAAACSQGLATDGDPSDERYALLSALIERAQGLLGSLETVAQGYGEGRE